MRLRPEAAARSLPALMVPVTVLLVCVPASWQAGGSTLYLADLASVVLVAVAGVVLLAGARLPRTPLRWAVAAYVATLGAATLAAADATVAGAGLLRYVQVFVLVPLGVAVLVRRARDLWLSLGAVIAAATIQGVVGTWQYLTGTGASFAGQDVRAIGTFDAGEVMAMATVVGYGIVVAVGLALSEPRAGTSQTRAGLLLLGGLLVVPLLLSLSRGALLATVVAVAVMLVAVSPRLAGKVAVLGVAGFVLVGTAGTDAPDATPRGAVSSRLATIGSVATSPDRSVQDRYDLWRASVGIWRSHPVAGVGLKQFPAFRDTHAPLSLSSGSDVADPSSGFRREPLLSPHNMYLLVLSEQGILGAGSFVALLAGLAVATIRRARRSADAGTGLPGARGVVATPAGVVVPPVVGNVAAAGLVTWTVVWFGYGDIGGPTTVLTSVLLGVALWWATQPLPADHGPRFMIGPLRDRQVHDRADRARPTLAAIR